MKGEGGRGKAEGGRRKGEGEQGARNARASPSAFRLPPSAVPLSYRADALRVSAYDRVASMLLALLLLIGTMVLALLLLWLTSQIFAGQAVVPVILEEIGSGDGPLGGSMELDAPTMEEIGQETDLTDPELSDRLAAIADAVASKTALLEDPLLSEEMNPKRGGGSKGDGRGGRIGSGTGSGTGRSRHWEVQFIKGNTLESYARQLDFFRIELGVLMPDNKVIYAKDFTKTKPDRYTSPADKEQRYYLTWRRGGLQAADSELLARAGISAKGKLILKFLPPDVETDMVQRERAYAGRGADKVRKTLFGIRQDGGGYSFYVMQQEKRSR